jgi:hypothetical protein
MPLGSVVMLFYVLLYYMPLQESLAGLLPGPSCTS